jgi:HEAT repeat protein
MSELDTPAGGPTTNGQEWEEDRPPVDRVQALFVTLGKAFRAYQLYDENNPVRRRFVDSLKGEFENLWGELDRLVVSIDEDHIYLGGSEVYRSETRADSLAFLFFKDGVREVTFLPGLESYELERFLGVLQRARKLVPEGDDLLTVLWEEELQYFQYQFVDLLAEGVPVPEPGTGNTQSEMQAVLEAEDTDEDEAAAEEGEAGEPPPPQTVSQDDFNPTLYVLDPREMEVLHGELEKELNRDTRADVLAALFDRLEETFNRERQSEILNILATLLPNFLSRGELVAATSVLSELRRLESTEGMFDEQRMEESSHILDAASAPDAIEELIQALYDSTVRASPAQLGSFLQFLRGSALAPLLRASETVDHKELQAVLRQAVQGIANRNRAAVVGLMQEKDPVLAAAAARMAGEMQIAEAATTLADLLSHADPSVRLAAVDAAVALKASTVAGALQHTLDDPERNVRIAAARALGELRYRPSARAFEEIVNSREIRSADITEKVAVFESYGMIAEAGAIALLDDLLNGKSFFGRREPTEIRAAAALGLGRINTVEARASLERAARDDDPVVRSNVNRALRVEG